ncbi:MAG: hypothetical protein GWN99_03335 [Gemmatimonadetes bacterium]|uniref:O-antigen ligase-like membrane protein n=1 Tax=Candidatus Kutchimonas denitrificans TaxID=3056748 RepID=A0AAE4Z6W1_9BACT|nr:hypothetical protein [Gemmatimonadota bacterium]NIR73827.1 hypothetical protein [Candidatus Kutchimonas denitrificans]NIS00100.1 hypothetical protein [Gemmatimonadota bacterium]NIT65689.1 hypothetical protein [Gemmatimonadota bacterium]NIU53137.1 hypothetical protein [Gemmatimonadota bacterium]
MRRTTVIVAVIVAGLAIAGGASVALAGPVAVALLIGLSIAAGAFVQLRITLLAILPAMVLLPELPLAVPLRVEDLLMAPLTAAWLARLAITRSPWPRTPLDWPILAVVVVELAALLWGAYRGTAGLSFELYSAAFFLLKTIEVAFLYFITVDTVRTARDLRIFTAVFVASATALGVWGVIESGSRGGDVAITGPAGHGGYSLLGLTYVVLLAVLVSLSLTRREGRVKAMMVAAALPVFYSLLYTFSRQSYVGAAAALAALLWFRRRVLLVPAMLAMLALPFVVPQAVEERATSIVTNAPDPATGSRPYGTRMRALRARLPEVLEQRPLLGFGPAALPPGFLDNQYLLVLYYTGLIGLAAFLWLLVAAGLTAYRAYAATTGTGRGLALAWMAATLGLALAGLAGSPFVAVRVRQIYWFLAALAVAALKLGHGRSGAVAEVAAGVEP